MSEDDIFDLYADSVDKETRRKYGLNLAQNISQSDEVFEISNESFAKDYEFVEKCGLDDIVSKKGTNETFKAFYKGDRVFLMQVSSKQNLAKFESLRGAMTKIILESGFKPDKSN